MKYCRFVWESKLNEKMKTDQTEVVGVEPNIQRGGRLDFANIKNFHILIFLKNVVDEARKHDFVM